MTRTIRVVMAARKGGAGKSALAVLLARELVRQGLKVLVLDLDPQRVGASLRLGADVRSPLAYTAVDLVLGQRGRPFSPQPIVRDRLDLIPGNQRDLASFERRLREMHEERRLTLGRDARHGMLDARLAAVEVGYHYVIVDTPTGFGEVTTSALEAAHLVLSPIDMKSADNVESVVDLLEHLEELRGRPAVCFVPNRWVSRERQCRLALARARALCGPRLLTDVSVPECAAVPRAMSEHRDLVASTETAAVLSQAVWRLGQLVIGFGFGAALAAGGVST